MNDSLSILVGIGVYLPLLSATFYYMVALDVLNKHSSSEKKLYITASLALLFSLATWIISKFTLLSYFAGELGYTTDLSVSINVPFYFILQTILLYIMAIVGITVLIILKKNISSIRERGVYHTMVITLSILGFACGGALMFLGVLIP